MLYANGCSFTDGFGLENETGAWPYYLGSMMGFDESEIKVEAYRGVSNQYIMRSSISTISKLIENDHKPSFVAIGMTVPSRREFFNSRENVLIHGIPALEWAPDDRFDGITNNEFKIFNDVYLKNFWSPVYDFHLYIMQVMSIQQFLKANDIDHVIFNSLNLLPDMQDDSTFKELSEKAHMMHVYNQLDLDFIYDKQTFFRFMEDNKLYIDNEEDEAFMHPTEEGHKQWAEVLMKDITATMMKKRLRK